MAGEILYTKLSEMRWNTQRCLLDAGLSDKALFEWKETDRRTTDSEKFFGFESTRQRAIQVRRAQRILIELHNEQADDDTQVNEAADRRISVLEDVLKNFGATGATYSKVMGDDIGSKPRSESFEFESLVREIMSVGLQFLKITLIIDPERAGC
jgi:hypothetical protein